MTLGLTPRLQELASFIRSYLAANDGIGPTHNEMKAAIGLKSKSGVARMVNELEERGVITRKKYGSRSIMITDDGIGAAVAAERERCAQIAEHLNGWGNLATRQSGLAEHIAKVIRLQKD